TPVTAFTRPARKGPTMRHLRPPNSEGSIVADCADTRARAAAPTSTPATTPAHHTLFNKTISPDLLGPADRSSTDRLGHRRGLEDVLIKPVPIVLHYRAARLRLRRPVAHALESFIDDQLRRNLQVLQPAIELVGVGRRDALIRSSVLDERRRLRALD